MAGEEIVNDTATTAPGQGAGQRADKWLWYARFFKSRTLAAKLCTGRKLRVNRQVIAKASNLVHVGDVLTFPQGHHIRVVKILDLGKRRGPAPEAQALYEDLSPIQPAGKRPAAAPKSGRPTKKQRRAIVRLKSGEGSNS